MTKHTVAIIGAGKWGKNLIREYSKHAHVKAILHGSNPQTREMLQSTYPHIPIVSSYEEILNDDDIEAVVIATPTETHFEFADKAIEHKKSVFLEKPGTTSPELLKTLKEQAEKNGVVLSIGYIFLYNNVIRYIKENIPTEDIQSVSFVFEKQGPFEYHPLEHLACHDIATTFYLGFNPELKSYEEIDIVDGRVDNIKLSLEEEGKEITIEIDRNSTKKERTITFKTTQGEFVFKNDELFKDSEKIEIPNEYSALENEVIENLSLLDSKQKSVSDAQLAIKVWEIMLASRSKQ